MEQHSHMSTQALLDQLAARERRVLEQLHELSGIDQSPISPRQAYASVQATPHGAQTCPTLPRPAEAVNEVDEAPSTQSRGTIGNLEQDLARLQHLLRHSPLQETYAAPSELCTPAVPRHTRHHDAGVERESAAAAEAREKRSRVSSSPLAPVSGSPAAPEVKRDRRETPHYARPPPPRRTNYFAEDDAAVSPERAPLPRSSTILDMTEGEEDGEAKGPWIAGVVRTPRGCTVPRAGATMFAARAGHGQETAGVRSYSEAHVQGTAPPSLSGPVDTARRWSRSPVRWFASPAHGLSQRRHAEEEHIPCTSAAFAREAHRSPRQYRDEKVLAKGTSVLTLGTPPPLHFQLNEASQLEMAPPGSFAFPSPPPRIPGAPSPLPRGAPAAAAAIPTPRVGAIDVSPLPLHVHTQRSAVTPQPAAKSHGVLREEAEGPAVAGSARRAASALPRGVTRTTSWRGLRSFFARQSRVAALLTPDLATVEKVQVRASLR